MARILLLTPQLPYPPQQGTSLRNFHIIRGIARQHEVTLLTFLEPGQPDDPVGWGPLTDLCAAIHTVPVPARTTAVRLWQLCTSRLPDMAHRLYSTEFAAVLRQLLTGEVKLQRRQGRREEESSENLLFSENSARSASLRLNAFDIVQIEGIELARYIKEIRVVNKKIKILFDNHNAETELQRRNLATDRANPRRWLAAAYSFIQVGRLARFERWACGTADAVTAVSKADKRHLEKLMEKNEPQRAQRAQSEENKKSPRALQSNHPITVIPNSIDVAAYQKSPEECYEFDLVFSGKMDYRPNVDAVLWFADMVWPLLRAKRPLATWAIVGQKPHPRLGGLRQMPGVTVTGWVESVTPYLHGASVFIMPFRIGSGTRLKLIEAMATGACIVSTTVGAEGFPVTHGWDILLVDEAAEMADAILFLLNRPADRHAMRQNARDFAQQYDWRVIVPAFETIYQNLLAALDT